MSEVINKFNKLLEDPKVNEIMINGTKGIFIEKEGKKSAVENIFKTDDEVMEVINDIFSKSYKRIDFNYPYGDICLPDGSRVNAIIPPLALQGPSITIRKFSSDIQSLDDLVKNGSLTQKTADFLVSCTKGKLNMIFSGGTGVGKTTTLEMLSYHLPEGERVVTIEDAAELKLHSKNLVSLETRDPDENEKGEVTLRDLIKNSLRMRPDRIIIGEVRGEEALDMLQAMSTGHRGTMAVIHGNSPIQVVGRLQAMVLSSGIKLPLEEIKKMIVDSLDIIVHQERFLDGSRRVTYISEVKGIERGEIVVQDLFAFKKEGMSADGKIQGRLKVVMRTYPKFFNEFRKEGLLDESIFLE